MHVLNELLDLLLFVGRFLIASKNWIQKLFLKWKCLQKISQKIQILIENSHNIILKLLTMKKIISQQSDPSTLKPYHIDYTDVGSTTSTQHSLDSSFQQKSSCPSHPSPDQHLCSSSYSHNTMQDQAQANQKTSKFAYYKRTVDWLTKKYRKFRLKLQTLYLAVSYLIKYMAMGVQLRHQAELIGAVCLLLAAKINEVHFPSVKSFLGALDFLITKRDLLQVEEEVVALFGFQLALDKNSYSILHEFFRTETEQKRKNAQKLLHFSISNPETLEFGETYLSLSIVYLLKPDALKQALGINRDKMKKIAFIVYNMYKEKKNQLVNKENCSC